MAIRQLPRCCGSVQIAVTWDDYAATWDEDEAVRAYSAAAFESLLRSCERSHFQLVDARVCDFGCGTGLLSEKLAARVSEVVAIDSSAKMIEELRGKMARLGSSRIVALEAMLDEDFVARSRHFRRPFDLIVCSSVCAFVDDYAATVGLLARQLRAGGLFVQWDWELDPSADEPFGLTRDGVREALEGAGLENVFVDIGFTAKVGDQQMAPLMGVGVRPPSPV